MYLNKSQNKGVNKMHIKLKETILLLFLGLFFVSCTMGIYHRHRQDYEVYYSQGNAYYDRGDYDDAINSYRLAISINPDYADAHYNMGYAYEKKGDNDNAVNSYRHAAKLGHKRAQNHLREKGYNW